MDEADEDVKGSKNEFELRVPKNMSHAAENVVNLNGNDSDKIYSSEKLGS